jgi:benzoate-CoA ligase family protein
LSDVDGAGLNIAEWILRAGADRPEASAIRCHAAGIDRGLTHGALRTRVMRTAGALRAAGLGPEQRVLVALPDLPELIEVFLGAIWSGAVPIVVNPGLTPETQRALVLDCGPVLAVTGAATGALGIPALTVEIDGRGTLADAVARAAPLAAPAATHAEDPAFWLLSSGTTGKAKGVVHLHRSVTHVVEGYGREILGLGAGDVCHATSKMFFAYGLGASLYLPLAAGASVALSPEPFAAARTWATLARERPSLFFAVPSVYRALLDQAPAGAADALASVRIAVSAGESLPEPLFEEWRRRFGVEILDGVGSTEMLHIYLSNRPGAVARGTVGRPVPGCEVRLVCDDGSPTAAGEIGMMLVRGGSLAERYWRRLEATRRAFHGEWYVSGDRATCGPDGTYRVLGRADDLFKVSGQWVLPSEVEALIAAVPGVVEVAVVADETGAGLLEVVACVVTDGDTEAAEIVARVQAEAAARLPRYKRPGRVVVVDRLPRTATGKLQRAVLRERVARGGC